MSYQLLHPAIFHPLLQYELSRGFRDCLKTESRTENQCVCRTDPASCKGLLSDAPHAHAHQTESSVGPLAPRFRHLLSEPTETPKDPDWHDRVNVSDDPCHSRRHRRGCDPRSGRWAQPCWPPPGRHGSAARPPPPPPRTRRALDSSEPGAETEGARTNRPPSCSRPPVRLSPQDPRPSRLPPVPECDDDPPQAQASGSRLRRAESTQAKLFVS